MLLNWIKQGIMAVRNPRYEGLSRLQIEYDELTSKVTQ